MWAKSSLDEILREAAARAEVLKCASPAEAVSLYWALVRRRARVGAPVRLSQRNDLIRVGPRQVAQQAPAAEEMAK